MRIVVACCLICLLTALWLFAYCFVDAIELLNRRFSWNTNSNTRGHHPVKERDKWDDVIHIHAYTISDCHPFWKVLKFNSSTFHGSKVLKMTPILKSYGKVMIFTLDSYYLHNIILLWPIVCLSVCHKPVFCQNSWIGWIRSAISIETAKWDWAGLWHRGYLCLSFILEGNLGIYKNKITSLWSLVPNSELSWFLANVHYMLSPIRLSSVCL